MSSNKLCDDISIRSVTEQFSILPGAYGCSVASQLNKLIMVDSWRCGAVLQPAGHKDVSITTWLNETKMVDLC